jgi:hypothetical protein
MHLQLRAVEKTELEKRLTKLERLVRDAFLNGEERRV